MYGCYDRAMSQNFLEESYVRVLDHAVLAHLDQRHHRHVIAPSDRNEQEQFVFQQVKHLVIVTAISPPRILSLIKERL